MSQKTLLRLSAIVAGISGITILMGTLYPIVSYEAKSKQKYPKLISPVAGVSEGAPTIESVDLTRASNWFVGDIDRGEFGQSQLSFYTISVPKLGIENARVAIGGEDLSDSLIQYPGTALPGRQGNSVIFGHSILPQFYNPKDYLAIFSTLPTLEKGDEIKINYDGVLFTYRVESMFEVLPTELEVLDQDTNDSYISLITCVPPGHPLKPKRLVVRAKVIPPSQANAVVN